MSLVMPNIYLSKNANFYILRFTFHILHFLSVFNRIDPLSTQNSKPKTQNFLLLLLFLPITLPATHIVGGEMNYTCLGNDDYEITLTIFRDCYNGNPNAWFDDPASVGVFSIQNDLLFEVQIPWEATLNDTLHPVLSNNCFVVPPDVCVHTTTYTTTINLPPRIGGYQLAYQRCCRNETIVNIIDPLDTGATYGVTISEAALLGCNSSPKFREWPPLYICVAEPIVFDQSAVDVDGDSIVYRLCTPLQGANPDVPQPQPPNPPPYEPVRWIDPPYNETNMLNGRAGDAALRINAATGLLTGLPNTIGQFVVGICVEEYRAGQLIATTRRDFQYNVGVCGKAVAGFAAPAIQCNDLRVEFINESLGANDFLWSFGDGTEAATRHPAHIYPDTGMYEVQLIVEPNSICADTFRQMLQLQETDLQVDFNYEFQACGDSLVVQFNDSSVDSFNTNLTYQWRINNGEVVSTIANPVLSFSGSGEQVVELTVFSANGCPQLRRDTFISPLITGFIVSDSIQICAGESVELKPQFAPDLHYEWSPVIGLNNPNSATPIARPDTTTTYTVRMSDEADFCAIQRAITVVVPPPIRLQLPPDTVICDPDFLLKVETAVPVTYQWSRGNALIATTDTLRVMPFGSVTYGLEVTDENSCTESEQVTITGHAVDVKMDSLQLVCPGEALSLQVENLDITDTLSYQWQPVDFILAGANTATPVVRLSTIGRQWFTVEISNQWGCTYVDSTAVVAVDTTDQIDFVFATQCSGLSVQFSSTSSHGAYYQWNFGDPSRPTAMATGANPTYTYPAAGEYEVTLTLPESLTCVAPLRKRVVVGEPEIMVDFSVDLTACAETATVLFSDLSINNQSNIEAYEWQFSNDENSSQQNVIVETDSSQILLATLIITSADGCVDSLTKEIPLQLIEHTVPDTVIICNGEATFLHPDFNENYQYQWSPATGLEDANAANPLANPSQTTTYQVTITDINNEICQLETEVVAVVPPIFAFTSPQDTTICENEITLNVQANPSLDYEWSSTENFATIISTTHQLGAFPVGEQTYYVRATDDFGCQQQAATTVTNATLDILLPAAQTICVGDSLTLQAVHLNPAFLTTFTWSPMTDLNDHTILQPIVTPSTSVTYVLNAQNEVGCTFGGDTRVNVFDFQPPLEIIADQTTLTTIDEVAQLNATLNEEYTYEWTPAMGLSNAFIPDPIAQPTTTTTYTLRITNRDGCSNERSITIEVLNLECRPPHIFVPQGFTPNGDGKNDVLLVRGVPIEQFYFAVYNRWGQLVFETTDKTVGWDGTFAGAELPSAVFAYYLEVSCFGGEEFITKGNVTLLR